MLSTVMQNAGTALMGIGRGEDPGDLKRLQQAIGSTRYWKYLLMAPRHLFNVIGGNDLGMRNQQCSRSHYGRRGPRSQHYLWCTH